MSDTPRTDAEAFYPHDSKYKVCDADFARTLERELNAANDEIEEKRKDVVYLATEKAKLEERIKRLEAELEQTKQDRNAIAKNTREPLLLQLDHANERIKRLEEAGDRMRLYCADPDDCFAWDRAKENKP
jgi:septal ring factor EnvC (AmiA/AmiB activator)